ncbi:hypothetical protein GE21DRAFT_1182141, partial [Neurospora crassa]
MSPDNQTYTTTSEAGSIAGYLYGHPSTSYEVEAIEEDWMDFFDFDAYERDISGTTMSSIGSSSFEPPTTPSFSIPTITEHGKAPATPAEGIRIPSRDSLASSVPSMPLVAMQQRLGDTGKDIEMDEDIVTCEDTELENVPVTADVFSTALSRRVTLSPSEATPIDPPWKASPTTSAISEAGDQGHQDAQSGRND